jgi:hypothetical protein
MESHPSGCGHFTVKQVSGPTGFGRKVMDIRRCFEILEIDATASAEEAKQAYKDMVNIWHPDRFSQNPRLKEKAEKKLKDLNVAYETVVRFNESKGTTEKQEGVRQGRVERDASQGSTEGAGRPAESHRTEAAFEAGTRLFLSACAYLYTSIRQYVATQVIQEEPKTEKGVEQKGFETRECKGGGPARRKGRGRGSGQGRRKGRGGGL